MILGQRRPRPSFFVCGLFLAAFVGFSAQCCGSALAQQPFQARQTSQHSEVIKVPGVRTLYMGFGNGEFRQVNEFGKIATDALKNCDKNGFDNAIYNLKLIVNQLNARYDGYVSIGNGIAASDTEGKRAFAEGAAAALNDANTAASVVNFLLRMQDWEHCKPPRTAAPVPETPKQDLVKIRDPAYRPSSQAPEPRKPRTTNIRAQPEPVKRYHVGTLWKRTEPPPEERQEIGARIGAPRTQAVSFTGFNIGGDVAGNFNTLGQTETFAATGFVTNQFSDSSNALGGGIVGGFLFSPWNNNILVGPFASVDFLNQSTNRTLPGGFFLGQTTNVIGTVGGQIGVVARPGLFVYGELGLALVNLDQNLNFSGPVTSVNQTVPGVNLGIGAAFQPFNWQVAGNPVAVFAQYNHIVLQDATFDNPGSPFFRYRNHNDIDQLKIGLKLIFEPIFPTLTGGFGGRVVNGR